MDPRVDLWLQGIGKWRKELTELRRIALDTALTEIVKWGKPCYTLPGENVAILYSFQDTCAVGFFKGVLLKHGAELLEAPGEHSQAMRMAKFTGAEQIAAQEAELRACFAEAIALAQAGAEVPFPERTEPDLPEELRQALAINPTLRKAFDALTPGRRRAYALTIGDAKQAATRVARVEKYRERILAGKGLND